VREIPDSYCVPGSKNYIVLADRIIAAEKGGRLTKDMAKKARIFKNEVNDLVHNTLELKMGAAKAIELTFDIVAELHQTKSGGKQ